MRQNIDSTEVSVCVDCDGDAAVFLKRPGGGVPSGLDIPALAEAVAARGLRLRGVSSSVHSAQAVRPTGACSTVGGDGSLADAVISLIDRCDEVLA